MLCTEFQRIFKSVDRVGDVPLAVCWSLLEDAQAVPLLLGRRCRTGFTAGTENEECKHDMVDQIVDSSVTIGLKGAQVCSF